MEKRRADVSFGAFFLVWATLKGWQVPDLHWRIVDWLDNEKSLLRVLMVFRGAAKSTIYAVFKAYRLWQDAELTSQVWAADDKLATKLTRDTLNVIRRHPWCVGMLMQSKPGTRAFWVAGATDARNASMEAIGVSSNATGSRAREVDFDDIEVPKNIKTAEARENLREKISESTHIAVPGAPFTFIGTPHTNDSIYTEQVNAGAALLKIPLFEYAARFEDTSSRTRYRFDHPIGEDGLYILAGIGTFARMLVEGRDYVRDGDEVVFTAPPSIVLDLYSYCAWPERFTPTDILKRRRATRTLNAWDSQYQLEAKPVSETRLDPNRLVVYDVEPHWEMRNRVKCLILGSVRLVGVVAWWDCSLGKVRSDASALCVVFTDGFGNLYWHRAVGLTGEIEVTDEADRAKLVGGQMHQLIETLAPLHVPHVKVEINGPGGHVPAIARKWLKPYGISVGEQFATVNKQTRILDAFEAPLSARFLWAHRSVAEGPGWDQLQDFNPLAKNAADDYIDAAAGAITETPVRVGRGNSIGISQGTHRENWRPSGGTHEVAVDY